MVVIAIREDNRDLAARLNNFERTPVRQTLITLKRPIIDTIVIKKVVENIFDVIEGMGIRIVSEDKAMTVTVLNLLSIRSVSLETLIRYF